MTARLSDHLREGDHASRPAATTVGVGTLYACEDHGIIYQSDGTAWANYVKVPPPGGADGDVLTKQSATDGDFAWEAAAGGGGGASLVDYAEVTYTGGDITLNQTAITAVHASLDLTISAAAGDLVEYGVSGLLSNVAQVVCFDVYTRPSGANVNPFGAGLSASLATLAGVMAWYAPAQAIDKPLSGSKARTLVSGDVSGGSTVLRLMYAKINTTARTFYANANLPLVVWAKNYGQGF